jgi:hypothetical protein
MDTYIGAYSHHLYAREMLYGNVVRVSTFCIFKMGHAVLHLVEVLFYKPKGRGFDSRWGHWILQLIQSFHPHYGPGVDSASIRNEHQESSWE